MHPLLLTLLAVCLARPLFLMEQDPVPPLTEQLNDDAFMVVSGLDRDDFMEQYEVNGVLARSLRYRKDSSLGDRVLVVDRRPN